MDQFIVETYARLLLWHILWDILPAAIDRLLAGELSLAEVPGYVGYLLSVEAQAVYVPAPDDAAYWLPGNAQALYGLPAVAWQSRMAPDCAQREPING